MNTATLPRPRLMQTPPPAQETQTPCAADPELFFSDLVADIKEAKEICRRCPLQIPCRTHALAAREEFGVWGATSSRDRRDLRSGITSPAQD